MNKHLDCQNHSVMEKGYDLRFMLL